MGPRRGRGRLIDRDAAASLVEVVHRSEVDARRVLVVAVGVVAEHLGVAPELLGPLGAAGSPADDAALAGILRPVLLGDAPGAASSRLPDRLGPLHQMLVDDDDRRRRGVHYTPPDAADALVVLALSHHGSGAGASPPTVLDPACGGGAFLLAAARALRAGGMEPGTVLGHLRGIDLDPLAVEVTAAALGAWAVTEGAVVGPWAAAAAHPAAREHRAAVPGLRAGDALDAATAWGADGPVDVVVGNPPFGGQLRARTARPRGRPTARDATGYADTAALFLERAVDEVAPTGVVVLLQPLSVLAARDTRRTRAGVGDRLAGVWFPARRLFDASVHVCAPVVGPVIDGASTADVVVHLDGERTDETVPRDRLVRQGSWAPLWAAASGVPAVELAGHARVGDRATAGAGFRQEFYELAASAREAGTGERRGPVPGTSRVVTTGLLDWGRTGWGERLATLARVRYRAPVVDAAAAQAGGGRLADAADGRLAPKVLVATQTRVVEAAVDAHGDLWPAVPVISVWPIDDGAAGGGATDRTAELWRLAAALMAPPVTAWAVLEAGGTARSPGAVKLSARQVARVPLPVDVDAWDRGAALLREVTADGTRGPTHDEVVEFARLLTAAHDLDPARRRQVLRWWWERHPSRGSRKI